MMSTRTAPKYALWVLAGIAMVVALGGCPRRHAPTVTFTSPADGATNVSTATKVTATFSETMDPETITEETFTVSLNGMPIVGVVSYTGVTAVFDPADALLPNTEYTAKLSTRIAGSHSNNKAGAEGRAKRFRSHDTLLGSYSWSFTTGDQSDVTPPTVSLTDPLNGAVDVRLGRNLSATFSEVMDPLTITSATFTLVQGITPVNGAVTYSGVTAIFNPTSPLLANTPYIATITNDVADLAGNTLTFSHSWTFTTGELVDTVGPAVTFTDPENADSGVATNTKIAVGFSEPMDPLTVTTATFTLFRGATQVSGTVAYVGITAVFTPTSGLQANTIYTAAISLAASDLAGNGLAGNFVWTFTTGASVDITAPAVTFINPLNASFDVALNKKIAAVFSETMNPLTISTDTFTLFEGATQVAGTVTYSGITAVFSPVGGLSADTTYTAAISLSAADLAGNNLPGNFVWTFTTGASPDTVAPSVSFIDPENATSNVAINKRIVATFSEAMDPLTINVLTYTLFRGSTPILGTVSYSGTAAVFSPVGGLATDTTYTAAISLSATDLAGNPLAGNFVWTFTTGGLADVIAPEIVLVDPTNAALDVVVNKKIAISFSETMDPLTIDTVAITLFQGATQIPGTVTYSGAIAVFVPNDDLLVSTPYTVAVSSEATDLAGNALAGNFVWSFTTGELLDTTAPAVSFSTPQNGAANVLTNSVIDITFGEAMDPATITTGTILLTQGVTPVSGTVTYSGATATFTPLSDLLPNTSYTATCLADAADLAGNTLGADFAATFTTGATK